MNRRQAIAALLGVPMAAKTIRQTPLDDVVWPDADIVGIDTVTVSSDYVNITSFVDADILWIDSNGVERRLTNKV